MNYLPMLFSKYSGYVRRLSMKLTHVVSLVLFLALMFFVPTADGKVSGVSYEQLNLPSSVKPSGLNREDVSRYFPPPFYVGEKDPEIPVWVIYKEGPVPKAVGYAFESLDFTQIPGFGGSPMNMLVAIDTEGEIVGVWLLSQHEPVFVGGIGEEPLKAFLKQYNGKSLLQNISVSSRLNRKGGISQDVVVLDGISKATVSVRIINQTVISTALQVARAKLGFAHGRDPTQVAHVRQDLFERKSWQELVKEGLVVHQRVYNRDVQKLFSGTSMEDADDIALAHPDDIFIDMYVALVTVPTIGHSLLDDQDIEEVTRYLDKQDHAILVMSSGRSSFIDAGFVRGAAPRMLSLTQDKIPMEMRDLDVEVTPKLAGVPQVDDIKVFLVASPAGLDPDLPWDLSLHVLRQKGIIYPEQIVKDIDVRYDLPERFVTRPVIKKELEGWQAEWMGRIWEIIALLLALGGLTAAIFLQKQLFASSRRLRLFRYLFYAFTLGFIGWYAQGQLSIVNITALLQAIKAGRSLAFYLYDPMTVILWGYVLITLVVWGRGTFCGWLCPFGALQEFVSLFARRFGIRPRSIKAPWNKRLNRVKHLVLAAILLATLFSTSMVDKLVEVEPFKTAITVTFMRSWPFVAYTVGLLFVGAFFYKFFCSYLCPLGAGLEILGRARCFKWLIRRKECGNPCQFCRKACDYEAIRRDGSIDYQECFQCLECVSIYCDPERCRAEIFQKKFGRPMTEADSVDEIQ